MWIHEYNLNYSIFVKLDGLEQIYTIGECWRKGVKILFEFGGSYYIYDDSGYSANYIKLKFGEDSTYIRTNYQAPPSDGFYIYHNGTNWVLILEYATNAEKFIKLDGREYQYGTYLWINDKWVAQVESHSDPVDDLNLGFPLVELYKSSSLTGVYAWQGSSPKDDIKVGWHYYTHKATDDEGNPTTTDVNVYESVQLLQPWSDWEYEYKGDTYTHTGDLPENNFNMTSGEKVLTMTYKGFVSLKKDVWKFDGGAQNVD